MDLDKLEYWTKFSFDKMKKERTTMPPVIIKILEMDEFKRSGISEEQLRKSIKERFIQQRAKIMNDVKDDLNKLRHEGKGQ